MVTKMDNALNKTYWTICPDCDGQGKSTASKGMKARFRKRNLRQQFENSKLEDVSAPTTKGPLIKCMYCSGTGLMPSDSKPIVNTEKYPHVAIIGGGIGGVALAVACFHRGIPFTLYERDSSFDDRSQGYGLTLQQASKAIEGLGILSLQKGVYSTKHVVHTTDGKIIGEWGIRNLTQPIDTTSPKRKNIHIARQSLRLALIEQLGGFNAITWGHQLIDFKECDGKGVELNFKVNEKMLTAKADLLVGADGIRSVLRKLIIGENASPLRYLGCIVILGICPLANLNGYKNTLLDSATVFQTANGNERIFIMPYATNSVMWQFSFPMLEEDAKALSAKGTKALKAETLKRAQWHEPIPQILAATLEAQITGYPVYDMALLNHELLKQANCVTLIGDAAHPMSPFKGQGANQALLDALTLARGITKGCIKSSDWKESGIRKNVLTDFEAEMLNRAGAKVQDSATAARLLHSENILNEVNEPRGRLKKTKDELL